MKLTSREDPAAADANSSASRSPALAFIRVLATVRRLHAAGAEVLAQLALHARLAKIEWAQEKHRLVQMLAFSLLGFACLLCAMLMFAVLIMAQSWDTAYRLHAAFGVLACYLLAAEFARRRLLTLAKAGADRFAASREEWAADIALIRRKL